LTVDEIATDHTHDSNKFQLEKMQFAKKFAPRGEFQQAPKAIAPDCPQDI
jgi:hypothetical protein